MNTARFIAIATAVIAVSSASLAFADENGSVQAQSTATRASVVAELARARAAGELVRTDADYGQFVPRQAAGTTTRAAVKAELLRASAAGELRQAGEGYAVFTPLEVRGSSTLTREAVKAEARSTAAKRTFDVSYIGG